jgi:hypothetical protein
MRLEAILEGSKTLSTAETHAQFARRPNVPLIKPEDINLFVALSGGTWKEELSHAWVKNKRRSR